jgi:hypothetical protein
MLAAQSIPDLRALVTPILGASYEQYNCYRLLKHLISTGFGLTLDDDPQRAAQAIVEVWYRGDTREPLALMQPWDCAILACRGPLSDHVGLVVDTQYFVHTRRRTGVCLEKVQRWQSKLLQIARLRILT